MQKQTLDWFKDQELSDVICVLPDGTEKEVSILSSKDVTHYHDMQERGYSFKKAIVIHKAVDSTCIGCEG